MEISRFNREGYYDPVPHMALSRIMREECMCETLVYVASPFSGEEVLNTENAKRYCRFAAERGVVPLAPHLFLPLFLSEEAEREEAMRMNMVFLSKCDELWVFGSNITRGMKAEIAWAKKSRMPVRYFEEGIEGRISEETR